MFVNYANSCKFNLTKLMRQHKVTIRDLSTRMDVTMKAIRKIREMDRVPYCVYCDYHQAVTGVNVFNYDRYVEMRAVESQGVCFEPLSRGV